MPKEVLNNKIIYQNIYGRIADFDNFLDQGVTTGDSPEFTNLHLTGNATIDGNLYVEGNTTLINTNVVEFEDNIILINRLEIGPGVTLNQSGFEIERGSLENYRVIFNESDKTFKIGVISNLQAVATREDTPLINGIMTWNNSTKRLDSVDLIKINTTFGSTTNSISSTTGSLITLGGLGIKKDLYIDGEINLVGSNNSNKSKIWTDTLTNILTIQSSQDINLTPQTKIKIPFNKPLTFGNDSQSIKANSGTNDIIIDGSGHIKINLQFGKRIDIPNLIPITFSTEFEKIYTNGFNNMVIAGSEHIELIPGAGKSVILPVDIPITFYNNTQKISSNLLNDLSIFAGNNIYINPGANLNVQLPYDAHLKFGNGGNQTIKSNTFNTLDITSNNEIKLTANSYVKIPTDIPLSFGNGYLETINGDTFGNLIVNANSKLKVYPITEFLNVTNSTTYANGAVIVSGGVGIEKNVNIGGNVFVGGNLTVQGTTTTVNSEIVTLKDNIFVINSDPSSEIDGGILVKRFSGNYAGIYYREATDEITFAYSSNDPGLGNIAINSYIPVRANSIYLEGTEDATDINNGNIISQGGASFKKSLIIGGDITAGSIYATGSSYLNDLRSDYTTITTQTCETIRITNELIIHSDLDVINATTASFVLNGGMSLVKSLWVGSKVRFFDTTPSLSLSTGNLVMNGGISIQTTENAKSVTSGGGITIAGGASIGKDLYIGGQININSMNLRSTEDSTNVSTGALIVQGGATINSKTNSQSITNGGSLTVAGGMSVAKDTFIGGKIEISDNLKVEKSLEYSGGGGIYTINNTTGNIQWYYLGQLNQTSDLDYFDCEISNSIKSDKYDTIHGIRVIISLQDTSVSFQQSHIGNLEYNETSKGDIYLYKEDLNDNYHIFYKTCSQSSSSIRVHHKTNTRINIINEGSIPNEPNGTSSGYNGLWVLINSSNKESNLNYNMGSLILNGDTFKTADPIPIIGNNTLYTNDNESNDRNVGMMFARYQKSNDNSNGDIVADIPAFNDIIPDQSTASSTQIKFSNSANNTDNYYTGWWVKINSGPCINQVRRIVSYNGSLRVAEVDTVWTTQNPGNATDISLYNFSYYAISFDEADKTAKFISTSTKTSQLNKIDYVSLHAKSIYLSDTTSSINKSTGSIVTLGGISINCTTNANSCTEGGSFTSAGGGSFRKNVYIGEKLGIGQSNFPIDESLHIKQQRSTIKLENDSNEYSYIDLSESGNNTRFGLLSKNSENIMSFTYNTTNVTPNLSESALAINSNGNIGIKTTSNIGSALTFAKNNIISLNGNNGYLGLIAGNASNINNNSGNTCGANILLNGAESNGDIVLSTGTIGNMKIYSQNELRFLLDKNGVINIYSTETSVNATTASLLLNGGMSINCTTNAESYTSGGGALTISGGMSVGKDTYINGDLYVKGKITSEEKVISLINFSDLQNCTVNTYGNTSIILNGNKAIFSFYIEIYPTVSSQNCQLEFELPEKTNNFINKMDLIATCNGYTDNTELTSLFNTLCVGKSGTSKGLLKFQSASTSLHYLNVICIYSTK